MIGLFPSNNGMVNFSKTEKKIIPQQTRNGPYIYKSTQKGAGAGVSKFVTCLENLLFLNKIFIVTN